MAPFRDKLFIVKIFFDNNINHAQQQGAVRARAQLKPQICCFGRFRTAGVDDNEFGAVFLCALDALPDGLVRMRRIAADEHYTAGILQFFDVHPIRPPAEKGSGHHR